MQQDTPVPSARRLFGEELVRLRESQGLTQHQLAGHVALARSQLALVEGGRRWPTQYLAARCDQVLRSGGTLSRLWPLVDAERLASKQILPGVALADLQEIVLHLAVATSTDLSVLSVRDIEDEDAPGGKDTGQPPLARGSG
jgi:transcriptional regulator with XRE-family HTH domain